MEGGANGRLPIPEEMRENVMNSAHHCDKRKKSENFCGYVEEYLESVGYIPDMSAKRSCAVFDVDKFNGGELSPEKEASVTKFCGVRPLFYAFKMLVRIFSPPLSRAETRKVLLVC